MAFLPVWHTHIFFPLFGWLGSGGLAASVRCPGTCLLQICQCWLSQLQQLLGARRETVQNAFQPAKQTLHASSTICPIKQGGHETCVQRCSMSTIVHDQSYNG